LLVTQTNTVAADARGDNRDTSGRRALDRRLFVDLAIGTSVVASLALPILLSRRAFFGDWGNHLYAVDQQTQWLRHHAPPTYFLHSVESGVFYPRYMFYGGSLYTVTGWLGVVLGSSVNAYRLTFVMAFAACYGGTLWAARQLGVRSLLAHVPAALAVSSAYFVSKAYNGGGWPEFIAVSMIPLVVAAALSIVRSKRVPLLSAIMLVASTFLLTGSHIITIEYGLLFLAVVTAIALVVYRRSLTRTLVSRFSVVGALMALSAALNGWFLVPLARYAHLTQIGGDSQFHRYDEATRSFESWRVVFNPLRTYPVLPIANVNPFYVQVPVYVLLWLACLGIFVLLRGQRSTNAAIYYSLLAVLGALFTLLLWQGIWDVLPNVLKVIQFRFRLHSYINYTVVGLVIVGLLMLACEPKTRAWVLAIALATATSLGFAIWQAWSAPKFLPISELVKTSNQLPRIQFANCQTPCPFAETDYRMPGDIGAGTLDELNVDVASARTGTATVRVPTGGPYRTNIAWSPVIELAGPARIIGATPEGWAVIARTTPPGETSTAVHARLRPRATGPVVAGRVVSAIAGATLLTWLLVVLILRAKRRGMQTRQLASTSC
jgi:hypothetical protein